MELDSLVVGLALALPLAELGSALPLVELGLASHPVGLGLAFLLEVSAKSLASVSVPASRLDCRGRKLPPGQRLSCCSVPRATRCKDPAAG